MGLILSLTNALKLNIISGLDSRKFNETDVDMCYKPSKIGTISNYTEFCSPAWLGLKLLKVSDPTFKLIY